MMAESSSSPPNVNPSRSITQTETVVENESHNEQVVRQSIENSEYDNID